MNISKFTQKSVEAVQNCEKLAYEYGNQQIDQEHLLVSLLKLDDSLILKLITKMGISGEQFAECRICISLQINKLCTGSDFQVAPGF